VGAHRDGGPAGLAAVARCQPDHIYAAAAAAVAAAAAAPSHACTDSTLSDIDGQREKGHTHTDNRLSFNFFFVPRYTLYHTRGRGNIRNEYKLSISLRLTSTFSQLASPSLTSSLSLHPATFVAPE
jgi:hypothetical protein